MAAATSGCSPIGPAQTPAQMCSAITVAGCFPPVVPGGVRRCPSPQAPWRVSSPASAWSPPPRGGQEATLFLSVQHPGEVNGTGQKDAREVQAHQLVDRNGVAFDQLRTVPLGSNWPSGVPGRPPRPGVVAIRRLEGGPLLRA